MEVDLKCGASPKMSLDVMIHWSFIGELFKVDLLEIFLRGKILKY